MMRRGRPALRSERARRGINRAGKPPFGKQALRSHIDHAPVDRHSVTAHRRMPPGGGPSFCRDWARGYTQRRMQGCRILLILFVSLAVQAQPAGTGIDGGGKVIEEYLVLGTVLWTNVATATIAIRGTTLIGRLHL